MFRASMCPSSDEKLCIYAKLIFVTLYGSAGWIEIQPATSIQSAGLNPTSRPDATHTE